MGVIRYVIGFLILCLLPVLAAGDDVGAAQRGASLLKPFKASLQAALRQGLEDGPVAAINACRVQAPAIARSLSRGSVRMGRASHRLRNPANLGPAWVTPLVRRYSNATAAGQPVTVALPSNRMGYVEPIYMQSQCLACHGKDIDAPVAAQLQALYPQDQAAGFEKGEFRGVFWVEFPQGL